MRCGISTACFYPEETSVSLRTIQNTGVKTVEIFLNTFRELDVEYVESLGEQLAVTGTRAVAVHPFTSMMEPFFFATEYAGRLQDGLELYRRYFDVCRRLSVPYLVFHGDHRHTSFSFAQYCENYLRLREEAMHFQVELCQENVARCKCGNPEYVLRMREYTHGDVGFVLDTKQARRAGFDAMNMLQAMGNCVRHVHLSDFIPENDCVVPGTGKEKFNCLFSGLCAQGFCGDMVIELYRNGFSSAEELRLAAERMEQLYNDALRGV